MGTESAECSREAPTKSGQVRGRAAKDANPSTLLTSPTQEELRRAPGAEGGECKNVRKCEGVKVVVGPMVSIGR